MASLVQQRCFNHGWREASARCMGCGQYFCRECVSEHKQRLLCARCLAAEMASAAAAGPRLRLFRPLLRLAMALLLLIVSFYFIGAILLSIPSTFHEDPATAQEEQQDS